MGELRSERGVVMQVGLFQQVHLSDHRPHAGLLLLGGSVQSLRLVFQHGQQRSVLPLADLHPVYHLRQVLHIRSPLVQEPREVVHAVGLGVEQLREVLGGVDGARTPRRAAASKARALQHLQASLQRLLLRPQQQVVAPQGVLLRLQQRQPPRQPVQHDGSAWRRSGAVGQTGGAGPAVREAAGVATGLRGGGQQEVELTAAVAGAAVDAALGSLQGRQPERRHWPLTKASVCYRL